MAEIFSNSRDFFKQDEKSVLFEPPLPHGSPDLPSLLFQRFVPVELAQELKVDVAMLSFVFTFLCVQPRCAHSHPCWKKTKH